jgi:hypothetical protein
MIIKKFIIVLLSSLIITGCMKNDRIIIERFVPVSISPVMTLEETKALLDNTNITGERVRVQVAKGDGSVAYNIDGDSKITLTYSDPNWVLSTMVYLSSDNAKLYAYCPCPADPTTVESGSYSSLKRSLNIPATVALSSQVDYLWAYQAKTVSEGANDINNANATVSLKLNHALTQVAFVIYRDNFTGVGSFTALKIKDNSVTPGLIINKSGENDLAVAMANGAITGGETTSEITVNTIGNTITENSDPGVDPAVLKTKVNGYALLAPVTIADITKVQFTFTIDSRDYSVSLTGGGGVTWSAGQQYIYKVKLSGTQMVIESVTVTPWTSNYGGSVDIQ